MVQQNVSLNEKEVNEMCIRDRNYTAENGRNHYQSTGIIPEKGKKQGTLGILTPREKSILLGITRNQSIPAFPSPHPTPLVYQQITSRKDNKEPGTFSLSAGQRFPHPA